MKIQTGRGTITLSALLAIYSISMVTSLPGLAISPILGDLERIFPEASTLKLQMLESLPSFIIVPFILLAGRLSMKVDNKQVLIIGLSIFFGCSVLYPFVQSLWLLLAISALLGVGAGIIIPFSTGLIANNFTTRYRTSQLGIASAITNLTLVLATFLAGVLAGLNWHYAFLVYCLSGVALLFAFRLQATLPNLPTDTGGSLPTRGMERRWPVGLMLFYYFITFVALTVPFNLSLYMENLRIGSSDLSGTLLSMFFLSMTVPGFFINRIIGWFKQDTNVISLSLMTLGYFLFVMKGGPVLLTIGVSFIGFGYGTMQPVIYDKTASSSSDAHATYALSLVMVMNYVAIITYPFIVQGLQELFTMNSAYFPFALSLVAGWAFTALAYFKRGTKTLGMKDES